jgi:hypothetical protein
MPLHDPLADPVLRLDWSIWSIKEEFVVTTKFYGKLVYLSVEIINLRISPVF